MGVRNIFSHGKKLSQRKFGRLYSKDARMKEVFGNQEIAKKLDKTSEKNEFYDALKSKKEGGVTKREMKEIFGEWMSGKGRTISRKEAYSVAKEFFGDERVKYIMPKKNVAASASGGKAGFFGRGGTANQNTQKSSGTAGNFLTSFSRPSISSSDLPTVYKKASASKAPQVPKVLASPVSGAVAAQSASGGSASGSQSVQSAQDEEKEKADRAEAKRKAQSKKRRKSISEGLAAIIDIMGPVKKEDPQSNKGDFFRAVNATRKNRGN